VRERAVAVTGGLGFVGAHLCHALAARGWRVRCVDRLSGAYGAGSGPDAWSSLASLQNVGLLRADVGRGPIDAALDGAEAVVHLAALPGVRARHASGELWSENVLSTARLAAEAARRGQRFVLASTSSVYGDAKRLPSTEDAAPAPLSPYATSKLAAEEASLSLASRHGADVVIARLFTVFGPGQRPDMAFARWIASIASGRPILWYAAREARREFTYVVDAAAGLLAALERGRPGEIYNVAGSGSTLLRDALHKIEEMLGRPAVVRHHRPSSPEAVATAACGLKTARELGYRPAFSLERGLERQLAAAAAGRNAIPAIA
jgi:nucleoside-diphosphate-sugar epimerase